MDEVLPEGPGEMGRGRHDEGAEAKGNEDHGSCLQGNKLEIEEDGDTVRKEETSSGAVAMTRAKSASGRKPRTKGLVKKLQEQVCICRTINCLISKYNNMTEDRRGLIISITNYY